MYCCCCCRRNTKHVTLLFVHAINNVLHFVLSDCKRLSYSFEFLSNTSLWDMYFSKSQNWPYRLYHWLITDSTTAQHQNQHLRVHLFYGGQGISISQNIKIILHCYRFFRRAKKNSDHTGELCPIYLCLSELVKKKNQFR